MRRIMIDNKGVNLKNLALFELPEFLNKLEINGDFYCQSNQLTSLINSPIRVRDFYCSYNKLESLTGAPSEVWGVFNCASNKLKTLKGSPREVNDYFTCALNRLDTLKGMPVTIGHEAALFGGDSTGGFCCAINNLTTLEGCSQNIYGDFNCHDNKLESLRGAPTKIINFTCSNNNLTSLEGAPTTVKNTFICHNNPLVSLKGIPKYIGGDFIYYPSKGGKQFEEGQIRELSSIKGNVYVDKTYIDEIEEIIQEIDFRDYEEMFEN